MKNKASLIPVALIALVGIVFASGIYFPDSNPSLPRLPAGPGTIGGVLYGLFAPDGTATNTEKLGGITATGYLHNNNCTDPINKKWVGVDADGKGICGNPTSLFAIGKFDSITPGVQVMKNGSSTWTPANTTDTLYPGDVIKTNGGTAMIDFALDASLLRLDVNTTLELRLGNLDGNSVAEAILSDGRLWGRILTSTGVNLGGGGVVAGVRGTSVSIEKSGMSYMMSIVDSQKSGNAGTVVPSTSSLDDRTTGTRIVSGNGTVLPTFTQVNAYSGTPNVSIYPITSTKENMITSSTWIRDNTKLDIDYLYANSGADTIIKNEYNITLPPSISTDILTALCSREEGGTDMNIYWKSLIGTTYTDKCRSSQLVAFADYTAISPNLSLYFSGTVVTENPGSTNDITGVGKYLAYNINLVSPDSMKGKILKIRLNTDIIKPVTGSKKYILDTGTFKVHKKDDDKFYSQTCNPTCGAAVQLSDIPSNSKDLEIRLPTGLVPSQFIIGNTSSFTPAYNFPIGTIINGIEIN